MNFQTDNIILIMTEANKKKLKRELKKKEAKS